MVSQFKKLYCEEQWQRQGAGLGSRRAQGRAGRACSRLGAGRAGAGHAGARRTGKARGACVLGVQAGMHGARGRGAQSAQGAQASGTAWASGALASARQGERARGRGRQRRSGRARGRAAGAGKGALGGWLGGLCASGVRSWARLGVLVHLIQFLAWFDSVFFPSHQMNTVHCKINFLKKNIF